MGQPVEYDPEADPLMGRLVSVLVPSGSSRGGKGGDGWRDGIILYNDTEELEDGTEVGTGNYRLMYGTFKSVEHAINTKKRKQKVRHGEAKRRVARAQHSRKPRASLSGNLQMFHRFSQSRFFFPPGRNVAPVECS